MTHFIYPNATQNAVVVQFPAHRRVVEGGLFRLAFQDGDCIYQFAGSSPVRSTRNLITLDVRSRST